MKQRFLHFPPIEKHGVIGDRRTAALVAADGTIDWFCLPNYDDDLIFGALLDPDRGGFYRFGPEAPALGEQHYEAGTVCLVTDWRDESGDLELADLMPWPGGQRERQNEEARVILRRLRAVRGEHRVRFEVRPRWTFEKAREVKLRDGCARFQVGEHTLGLWTSFQAELDLDEDGISASFILRDGQQVWAMIGMDEDSIRWNAERCGELFEKTNAYWRDWSRGLKAFPPAESILRRCAMTVHLLAHAGNDAVLAGVTASLPERLGGDRNYDYRYTWVRDASLSIAFLATMGKFDEAERYFTWLCRLDSRVAAPLQVCYRTNGQTDLDVRELDGVAGYRNSRPVQFGNIAFRQRQLGSLGWFADSALIFLQAGGKWKAEFWHMLRRVAEYVCEAWEEPDNGIWELEIQAHYVASKVMSWVALDRAGQIARRLAEAIPGKWEKASRAIRDEVLAKGWSEKEGAFRQRYDSETIDASALLIPLMNFLPPDDPRVLGTLKAIGRGLLVGGLVHRFDPSATLGGEQLPIGEFEGAFLPATFWYAHAFAGAGYRDEAARLLRRCEEIAGGPGIYAEEADARSGTFLGNTPLLFSQVEYARALLALHQAHSKAPVLDPKIS